MSDPQEQWVRMLAYIRVKRAAQAHARWRARWAAVWGFFWGGVVVVIATFLLAIAQRVFR